MVYGQIVEGTPREIANQITDLVGERRVKVMLMNDAELNVESRPSFTDEEIEKALADIRNLAVSAGNHVDDSREAIYTRQDGE